MDLREKLARVKENITATIPQRTLSNFLHSTYGEKRGKLFSKKEIDQEIRSLPYDAIHLAEQHSADKDSIFYDAYGNVWQIISNTPQNMEISLSTDKGRLVISSTYSDGLKKDCAILSNRQDEAMVEFTSIGGLINIVRPDKNKVAS